jgi:histidinol dehydrogenase
VCKEVREAAVRDFRKDMTEQTANINWGRKKVMRIVKLNEQTKDGLIRNLLKRSPDSYGEYEETVNGIIKEIREKGDKALFGYTQKFDRCEITAETVRVTKEEIKEAYELADPELVAVMKKSAANITEFHSHQLRNSWIVPKEDGTILGQRITPVAVSGVYVPGGKAAYPSSVLMNVLPAKVAGVPRIIMTTPPGADGKVNPGTLVAADIAGVDEIYKAGGAQAIAAMAFGTESIPRVDKITGPGNIFVALAKKACFGFVSIDSVAGPSEILVLADETANPRYVAADLLSQAEHDELASAILITTSRELAEKVSDEAARFTQQLSRKEIIEKSLENYGYILLAETMDEAVSAANEIASEHLEILTANPFETMTKIKNAGAIFLGEYSSEPLGDYFAGPNHILPTNGTARFFSPLNVDDFLKKTSIISYSEDALSRVHKDIELFAEKEGLTAHANSVKVRFE